MEGETMNFSPAAAASPGVAILVSISRQCRTRLAVGIALLLSACEPPQCAPGHHKWRMTFDGGFFHIEACEICHKVRQTGEE